MILKTLTHRSLHRPRLRPTLGAAALLLATLVLTVSPSPAQTPKTSDTLDTSGGPDTLTLPPVVCNVRASDVPNDGGGVLLVTWEPPDDDARAASIIRYDVFRYSPGEEPTLVGEALPGELAFNDDSAESGASYQYFVRSVSATGQADSEASGAAVAYAQWFARNRFNVLVVTVLFCAAVLFFVRRARGGTDLFIRKIPGLEAVDDAVGRATEMGRPVLYVPGIETVSEVGTLAALTILGHVAKRVATHGTPLEVPVADPIVMTTAQEIVKAAYAEVGQPDAYDPNRVAYLTYDQFGYTAGVDGIMVRERPEAVFLLGTFYAESLILAETGHAIGAIQIAGTKETSQLPFFVAACDYTLIGEELFAASSYLSREPVMLGSLKGQDLAKMWIVLVIAFSFVVGTAGHLIDAGGESVLSKIFNAVSAWFG
jgi:hypothetical protein